MVHLNGSGKKNLIDGYLEAARTVNASIVKICEHYPHMRDYYALDNGDELFKQAQQQHYDRIDKLREIALELNTIALGVHNQ